MWVVGIYGLRRTRRQRGKSGAKGRCRNRPLSEIRGPGWRALGRSTSLADCPRRRRQLSNVATVGALPHAGESDSAVPREHHFHARGIGRHLAHRRAAYLTIGEVMSPAIPTSTASSVPDDGYETLLSAVRAHFASAVEASAQLFTTDATGLWDLYLENAPAESRSIRTCSTCKKFIARFGGLVTIAADGSIAPALWPHPCCTNRVSRSQFATTWCAASRRYSERRTTEHLDRGTVRSSAYADRIGTCRRAGHAARSTLLPAGAGAGIRDDSRHKKIFRRGAA